MNLLLGCFGLLNLSSLFNDQLLGQVNLLGGIADAKAWYAVPLVIAISLVYGATRHEHPREIVAHAIRSGFWVIGFMSIILVIILIAGFWN